MSRTIRSQRPRHLCLILNRQEDIPESSLQGHRPPRVGQVLRIGSQNVREPVDGLDILGLSGYDHKLASLQLEPFGKHILDIAGQPKAGEILKDRPGIVEFDEFQVPPRIILTRMIHQLGDHESGGTNKGSKGFSIPGERGQRCAHHRAQIPKLRRGRSAGVMTGDRQAEVEC